MSLRIITAEAADAELVANLSRETFYDTFARHNTAEDMEKFMNEQFTKEALMKEVGLPGNIFLLAYDEETPVGYVKMQPGDLYPAFNGQPSVEIARIYATQSAIGKGVGKALMQECITIATGLQKKIIWLGVWEHNERAIAFYIKAGFQKFGTHDFVLGNDVQTDWLMMKWL